MLRPPAFGARFGGVSALQNNIFLVALIIGEMDNSRISTSVRRGVACQK